MVWTTRKGINDLPDGEITGEAAEKLIGNWRTVGDRLWRLVSVHEHGATGDGTTNDTADIQAALDAIDSAGGGIVYFPTGVYRVNGPLTIGNNTAVVGTGAGSVLRNLANANSVIFTNKDTANGNSRIVIRDLYVDGDRDNQTGAFSVIQLVRVEQCIVERNWVTGGLRTGTFPSVSRWGEGIEMIGGTDNTVRSNQCFLNSYDGIKTRSEHRIAIVANHCRDNDRSGIQISYASSGVGFGFEGSEDDVSDGTLHYVAVGNVISHSTGASGAAAPRTSGIFLHTASHGSLTGNQINGVSQAFGTWGACIQNRIAGNFLSSRPDIDTGDTSAVVSFGTSHAQRNAISGNTAVAESGTSERYVADYGNNNRYRGNHFLLGGGVGTWVLRFEGNNNRYVGNDQESASVTDNGTGNEISLVDAEFAE